MWRYISSILILHVEIALLKGCYLGSLIQSRNFFLENRSESCRTWKYTIYGGLLPCGRWCANVVGPHHQRLNAMHNLIIKVNRVPASLWVLLCSTSYLSLGAVMVGSPVWHKEIPTVLFSAWSTKSTLLTQWESRKHSSWGTEKLLSNLWIYLTPLNCIFICIMQMSKCLTLTVAEVERPCMFACPEMFYCQILWYQRVGASLHPRLIP